MFYRKEKDVMKSMLSFEKFLVIINYLINRLQNHSIYVSSKHQGGWIKEAPQFLAFIDDIECKEDEIEYVLNILSCGDNTNSKDTGIFFVKIGKELTIQTKTQRNCYLLQTINDNLRLFNENKDKKIELSKILNNQNEMYKLLIEDIEKPAILNELLKENRKFGMIQGVNHEKYIQHSNSNINNDTEKEYLKNEVRKNLEARKKGGSNSHSKQSSNRELEKIVQQLVLKYSNKAYEQRGDFYEDICNTLIKENQKLLENYSAYKKYLEDENVDWQRTIKDWCRAFMEAKKITLNIKKTKKKNYTYH